jgi:hypothetical protein
MRYTDPIQNQPKPTSQISYRIRVTPKLQSSTKRNQPMYFYETAQPSGKWTPRVSGDMPKIHVSGGIRRISDGCGPRISFEPVLVAEEHRHLTLTDLANIYGQNTNTALLLSKTMLVSPGEASSNDQAVGKLPSFKALYRNYKGEASMREIIPIRVWFGNTQWHPEDQWMMTAFDLGKQANRDFALKDFGNINEVASTDGINQAIERVERLNSAMKEVEEHLFVELSLRQQVALKFSAARLQRHGIAGLAESFALADAFLAFPEPKESE